MYEYYATLDRVIDGDTIIALVDLGFENYTKQRFRLAYINAPEIRGEEKEEGSVSRDALIALFEKYDNKLFINSIGKDRYGRYLADIVLKENRDSVHQVHVSEYLVDNNFAIPYSK